MVVAEEHIQCDSTGPLCYWNTSCPDLPTNSYQWCGSCTSFLQCRGSENYFFQCQAGLVYDHNLKRCDYESETCTCSINTLPRQYCSLFLDLFLFSLVSSMTHRIHVTILRPWAAYTISSFASKSWRRARVASTLCRVSSLGP